MHLPSPLTLLLALTAASTAMAQCRNNAGVRELLCDGNTECDQSRANALGNLCGAGMRTNNVRVQWDRCDPWGYCEWTVSLSPVRAPI